MMRDALGGAPLRASLSRDVMAADLLRVGDGEI